jgi:hypothetical protein
MSKEVRALSGDNVVVFARYRVHEEAPDALEWKAIKKQGFLTKQGGGNSLMGRKNWKKRFFDLRDGILSYAEQPNDPDLGAIVLKGVRLQTKKQKQKTKKKKKKKKKKGSFRR